MDKVIEMALKMLEPVEEIATGSGMKALFSDDIKAGDRCIREARKLAKSGDVRKASSKYDDALRYYNKVRSEATKIQDEGVLDWIISLCIKPWPILVTQLSYSAGRKGMLKGMTRESTIKILDDCISNIRREKEQI